MTATRHLPTEYFADMTDPDRTGPDLGDTEPVTLWSLREDVRVVQDDTGPGVVLATDAHRVRLPNPTPVVRAALQRMTLGPVLLGNVVGTDDVDEFGSESSIDDLLRDARDFVVRSLRSADALGPLLSLVPRVDRAASAVDHLLTPPPGVEMRLAPDVIARPVPGAGMRLSSEHSRYEALFHRPEACWLIGRLAFPSTASVVAREAPLPQAMVTAAIGYLYSVGLVQALTASIGEAR